MKTSQLAWLLLTFCIIFTLSVACSPRTSEIEPTSQGPNLSPSPTEGSVDTITRFTPTWTATFSPTSTHTPLPPTPTLADTPTPTPVTPTIPPCTDLAEFVRHLSTGLKTALQQEQPFAKIWRVKNIGTCTWTTDYALTLEDGDAMSKSSSIALSKEVPPGETIDLRVDMIAPKEPGLHTGHWVFKAPSGVAFGVNGTSSQFLEAVIWVIDPNAPKPYTICG